MNKYLILIFFILSLLCPIAKTNGQTNYLDYHKEIIRCEKLIAERKFGNAIMKFDSLFNHFEFVFLRDCKVAAQLSAFEQNSKSAFRFLRLGILNGWTLKSIENDEKLSFFREDSQWRDIQSEYDSLHSRYLKGINIPLKEQVHKMYKRDQKKALGALLRIGQKAQVKYAEKKFAPHSEKQLYQLNDILEQHGYPGERLIGNSWWVSVILSHHNSISENYNSKDTLYTYLKPKLTEALENGEVSPYTLATIEDWRTAALNKHNLTSYGFLGAIPNDSVLEVVNKNRADIGIRSIELRNKLIEIEKETGLNLYLPRDWKKEKITVANQKK
jgi:hypothetical protein